jgi:uncharacterized protein (TIGR02246 family)
MKSKTNQLKVLTLLFALTFGIQSCNSNYQDAIEQINKKFQNAYETKNDKVIKALYTDDATLVTPYGTVQGSEAIRISLKEDFSNHDSSTQMKITIESIETKTDETLIVKGRFHITGNKLNPNLPFELEGPYTHTCVNDNGKWKISKTDYTADLNIND